MLQAKVKQRDLGLTDLLKQTEETKKRFSDKVPNIKIIAVINKPNILDVPFYFSEQLFMRSLRYIHRSWGLG